MDVSWRAGPFHGHGPSGNREMIEFSKQLGIFRQDLECGDHKGRKKGYDKKRVSNFEFRY